jgi:hypothetical protein
MIVYHESNDLYHCIYRMCLILSIKGIDRIPIAQCKVLDFLLLFPFLIASCRLPREFISMRNSALSLKNKYNSQFDKQTMFYRIEPIQDEALTHLGCLDIINQEVLRTGFVCLGNRQIPKIMYSKIKDKLKTEKDVDRFIFDVLAKMPWSGIDGLKSRSKLMDNRYDL